MKKIALTIAVVMIAISSVWVVDIWGKTVFENELVVGREITINKNQPIAAGELICSIKETFEATRGQFGDKVTGAKLFSYSYKGIENGEILISYSDSMPRSPRFKLPIDKKGQAKFKFNMNQTLLITVVDKENHITVEGTDNFKSSVGTSYSPE